MRRTFFEHLGVAHLEKIHTQTLSWIFSNQNDGIGDYGKEELASKLFKLEKFKISQNITEFEKIDLIFKSKTTVVCIENKLNSSLHSNQLKRYEKRIKEIYPGMKHKFFFLSLINPPKKEEKWTSITYGDLLSVLKELHLRSNTNGVILKEYVCTLQNFDDVLNSFLKDPESFPNVFEDGWKSKAVKLKDSIIEGKQEFVRNNQLETIFQKLYYQKIADNLKLEDYYVDETRGKAILGINYYQKLDIKGKKINIGFDFQNGTFKIYCAASDYKKSIPEDVPKEIVEILQDKDGKLPKYKFYKPKTKGHYSLTYRRKDLFGIGLKEFSKEFENEMRVASHFIESELINTLLEKNLM